MCACNLNTCYYPKHMWVFCMCWCVSMYRDAKTANAKDAFRTAWSRMQKFGDAYGIQNLKCRMCAPYVCILCFCYVAKNASVHVFFNICIISTYSICAHVRKSIHRDVGAFIHSRIWSNLKITMQPKYCNAIFETRFCNKHWCQRAWQEIITWYCWWWRNPAITSWGWQFIPLFTGFYASQVVGHLGFLVAINRWVWLFPLPRGSSVSTPDVEPQ